MHVVFDANHRSPEQRAKGVLDVCAYELKSINVGDLMTLEAAIASEIKLALEDQIRILIQSHVIPKNSVYKAHLNGVGFNQPKLLSIRQRKRDEV